MIRHQMIEQEGVLVVKPEGRLESRDFDEMSRIADSYVDHHGPLHGLVIDAKEFPGWADLRAVARHARFVRDHVRHVERVAVVTANPVMSRLPAVFGRFISSEVRAFAPDERIAAIEWAEQRH